VGKVGRRKRLGWKKEVEMRCGKYEKRGKGGKGRKGKG
jgi:hypothetical protein